MPAGLTLGRRLPLLAIEGQLFQPTPADHSWSSQLDLLTDGREVEAQVFDRDDGVDWYGSAVGDDFGESVSDSAFDVLVGDGAAGCDGRAAGKCRASGQVIVRTFHDEHGVSDGSLHRAIAGSAASAAAADLPQASLAPARWANTHAHTSPCRWEVPGRPYSDRLYMTKKSRQDGSSVSNRRQMHHR